MSDTVYKKIDITGTSTTSVEDAVQNAINKAGETVRNLRWFEVKEVRGAILDDLRGFGIRRSAFRRIVFETAILRRVMGGRDDHTVSQTAFYPQVRGQDGM